MKAFKRLFRSSSKRRDSESSTKSDMGRQPTESRPWMEEPAVQPAIEKKQMTVEPSNPLALQREGSFKKNIKFLGKTKPDTLERIKESGGKQRLSWEAKSSSAQPVEPPGKRGSTLKLMAEDEKFVDEKWGLRGKDKKAKPSRNGSSPSLDEVVVPQTGVVDRHSTVSRAYDSIPLLEQTKLPRGGVSVETQAVGRVQFGIPPETIKDSMRLGIDVPQIYIVPAERFCRDMGPALGVNLAEFEFPGYFNFFVRQKTCTLVVDSQEAEDNICLVFEETLLGPKKFRREVDPDAYDEQDFSPDFPKDQIPNFEKELGHFRNFGGKELTVDMMLKFCHFEQPADGYCHDSLGVPPNLDAINDDEVHELVQQDYDEATEESDNEEAEEEDELTEVPKDEKEVAAMEKTTNKWSYGRARWVGDVATVWPSTATEEEKRNRSVPRVEIFKMPSGTEYIIHDVNADNIVIGRARFSGNVKVNESIGVEGFGGKSLLDLLDDDGSDSLDSEVLSVIPRSPPSFYPPSFGVTILGNSHGFDKDGSVSGYVLWINGRGLMIDPPPYSSATLEREGIRPRTIVGIILTHTHSDHDAGAFQKVLTGSPVVVITTPTIYKSFIRKYAALASLNPALLRHCHRYKPAIIGEDLRFQGATFKFFYSLHSIPCVGFRVEWRGRSILFSGDHLHDPAMITKLEEKGVLLPGRAEELRTRPLQNTDLLLHEAGVPPLHTAFAELDKLPTRVKKRMYVVHSSQIPDEFDLRKAPTGTSGTLRLDEIQKNGNSDLIRCGVSTFVNANANSSTNSVPVRFEDDEMTFDSASAEYLQVEETAKKMQNQTEKMQSQTAQFDRSSIMRKARRSSLIVAGTRGKAAIPLVSMRPTSNTDSWYMLNLLQAVPFLTSLPYTSTMEVLESTRVEALNKNDIVVPAARRNEILCVIWEGTCVERRASASSVLSLIDEDESHYKKTEKSIAVWHSGDWTGPVALQPDRRLSGESDNAKTDDIVATSNEGAKVITLEFSTLHRILKNGSPLYRKYLKRQKSSGSNYEVHIPAAITPSTAQLLKESSEKLNIMDLIDMNTALRKLSAVQKRHLECIAEGPVAYNPGERLWRAGAPVDKAFLVVAGTAAFVIRRRNSTISVANSGMLNNFDGGMRNAKGELDPEGDVQVSALEKDSDHRRIDSDSEDDAIVSLEGLFGRSKRKTGKTKSMSDADDFDRLSKTLIRRAESLGRDDTVSVCDSHDEFSQSSDGQLSTELSDDRDRRSSLTRRRSSRARFVNKALVRLYDRRTFTGGLVFSKGHFLGDVSKMVAGLLSATGDSSVAGDSSGQGEESLPSFGFGEKKDKNDRNEILSNMVIHEKDVEGRILHTSTLTADQGGCIVLVFPRESLTEFLDAHPGLLLSLLGTQVIV